MRSTDNVCFCQEMVRTILARHHSNSQCDVSMNSCGNGGWKANIADSPVKEWELYRGLPRCR